MLSGLSELQKKESQAKWDGCFPTHAQAYQTIHAPYTAQNAQTNRTVAIV